MAIEAGGSAANDLWTVGFGVLASLDASEWNAHQAGLKEAFLSTHCQNYCPEFMHR